MNNKSKNLFLGFLFTLLILVSITAISAADTNTTDTHSDVRDVTTQTAEPLEKVASAQVTKTRENDNKIKTTNKKETIKNTTTNTKTVKTTTKSLKQETAGTFTQLQQKIDNETTDTLTLTQSYTRGTDEEEITIAKTITIDGNGYTLNANGNKRIFIIRGGKVILKNMTITNSTVTAIQIKNGADVTENNINATNNKGFIGTVNCNTGNLTINNSTFTNNNELGTGRGDGGGVNYNCENGNLTINNSTFTNNKADGGGGVNYNDKGSNLIINNSTFTNNYGYDGGVNNNQGNMIINNGTFTNNTSEFGGVNYNDGTLTITDGTYTNNNANYAGVNYNTDTLTITDGTYTNNKATIGGINHNSNNLTINNGTYTNNKATNGSINYNYARSTLTINSGNFTGNNADYGGVNYNYGTLTINNGTYTNNKVTKKGGVNYNNEGCTLTINSGNFTGNNADYGGVNYNYGTLTINNGIYTYNTATSGGVNYKSKNTLTINNGTFTNNTATTIGGVNYNYQDNLTINNGNYTGNKANSGGVNINIGNLTINNGTYTNNTAIEGGVNYNELKGTLTINNGTYTNNSAYSNSNKIYTYGGVNYNTGTLTINNGTFSDNNASTGSVLYNRNGIITINNSYFTLNYGYVLFTEEGTFTVVNNEFRDNLCNNHLFNEDMTPSTLWISDNTYIGNNLTTQTMNIVPDTITSRGELNLQVTVKPDDIYNTTITTGNITIYEDNEKIKTVPVIDGTPSIQYTPHAGEYNITAIYTDMTNSYTTTNKNVSLNVPKTETKVEATILNYTATNNRIQVTVTDIENNKVTVGNIIITDEKDQVVGSGTVGNDGIVIITTTLNIKGTYTLTVTYLENENYTSNNTILENMGITGKEAQIKADVINNTAGNTTIEISIIDPVTDTIIPNAYINITLPDETTITENTGETGTVRTTLDLSAGKSNIIITHNEDETYNTTKITLTIQKHPSTTTANTTNNMIGEVTIETNITDPETKKPLTSGTVTIINKEGTTIGNGTINETGTATITTNIKARGTYNLTIIYNGNQNYTSSNTTLKNIEITGKKSQINMTILNNTAGNTTIKVTLTDPETDDVIQYADLEIILPNGTTITNKTGSDGTATIKTDITQTGPQKITVRYNGDDNYENTTTTRDINVVKVATIIKIDADDVKVGENITIKVTLKDNNNLLSNKNITLTINGLTINRTTNAEGIITYNYTTKTTTTVLITAKYNGDDIYKTANNSTQVKVNTLQTFITMEDITTRINDTTTITITVKDEKENNVTTGRIILKLNGKTLRDENGDILSATVENGIATVKDVKFNQKPGQYTITTLYGGSTNYEPSLNADTILTVTPRDVQLTIDDMPSVITTQTEVSLKINVTDNSIPVNTGRIIIKINGKTIRDSNANMITATVTNGTADIKFTLPDTFKTKTYTLTAIYSDKLYNRAENTTQTTITNPTDITTAQTIKDNTPKTAKI